MSEASAKRVKITLDEGRMLVLVVEVLIGFAYQAVYQPGFDRLSSFSRDVLFAAFLLLLVTFGLLLMIPAHHRLLEGGRDSDRFSRFATLTLGVALVPFAVALALELLVVSEAVIGRTGALIISSGMLGAAFFGWFLIPALRSCSTPHKPPKPMNPNLPSLEHRIEQVLTECRVVLPGTQALLGFQLIAFFTDGFVKLTEGERVGHLIALVAILLSAILLMLPAAYHRIGERGRDSEHLFRVANLCLLLALITLAIGITIDFHIVARRSLGDALEAFLAAGVAFSFFMTIWFAVPLWRRSRQRS